MEIITFQIILIYIIFRKSEQDDKGFIVVIFVVDINYGTKPPVDLHWFFEISISAFISNWDKNSVMN